MSNAVMTLLSISLSGSILALLVFALKPLIGNRVSKAFSYYIWLLVLLRLSLPFGFGIELSEYVPAPVADAIVSISSGNVINAPAQENAPVNGAKGTNTESIDILSPVDGLSDTAVKSTNNVGLLTTVKDNLTAVWLAGMLVSILWYATAYTVFKRRIYRSLTAPHTDDFAVFKELYGGKRLGFAFSDNVSTPMLIGVFRPILVVPQLAYIESGMETELRNILRHELTHYRRHDTLYKWFTILVCSVHWFNPLVYLINREISRACELSCDEAVIREMSPDQRRSYGNTLLTLAAKRRLPAGVMATTLCSEKRHLKGRLLGIMNYKKKSGLAIALMLAMTLLLAGCASVYTAFEPEADAPEALDLLPDILELPDIPDVHEAPDLETAVDEELEAFTRLVADVEALLKGNEFGIDCDADYDTYTIVIPFDESILFNSSDTHIIRPEAHALLDDISAFLKEHIAEFENAHVKGYRGTSIYDDTSADEWSFCFNRTFSMLYYIIDKNEIDSKKFTASATDDDRPAETGDTTDNSTPKRCVDLIIQAYKAD